MQEKVLNEINRLVSILKNSQSKNGAWYYCYESGIMSDAYMIILLRSLEVNDEELIKELVLRLKMTQKENGTWKLYHDETSGNLSATVEAYYALLFSGLSKETEPEMIKAKQFILANGGLENTSPLTKVMLALTGQYPWPKNFKIPIEFLLLPLTFPINVFEFVGYSRVHFIPIMVSINKKFSLKTINTPNLSPLYLNTGKKHSFELNNDVYFINSIFTDLKKMPYHFRSLALKSAEQFMLGRIEYDGTLYSYFSSTFLMIFALLALGYKKNSPVIIRAIEGLKTFICKTEDTIHLQNSTSTIWDTSLISYTLQEAGVTNNNPIIQKANHYLLSKQQYKYGDWVIHNPFVVPGGWGFSESNTINPDVDDTTASLRALYKLSKFNKKYKNAWKRGVNWLISMQNNDGGWPAFEKNTYNKLATLIPIEGVKSVLIDPSSADLTGRTLEFLGNYTGLKLDNPKIRKGVNWLIKNQEKNGSWYGRWGISYIYGTWAALTGMKAASVHSDHPAIQKASRWLLEIQNDDGGWGESCKSDAAKHYIPLYASTPSQTAWALDALIAVYDYSIPAIERGIDRLVSFSDDDQDDWRISYPTGAGLPGGFYTNYHSYRYIWPLLTLAHYKTTLKNLYIV